MQCKFWWFQFTKMLGISPQQYAISPHNLTRIQLSYSIWKFDWLFFSKEHSSELGQHIDLVKPIFESSFQALQYEWIHFCLAKWNLWIFQCGDIRKTSVATAFCNTLCLQFFADGAREMHFLHWEHFDSDYYILYFICTIHPILSIHHENITQSISSMHQVITNLVVLFPNSASTKSC